MAKADKSRLEEAQEEFQHELERLCDDWWWFLLLGLGMILLGVIALGNAAFTTVTAVVLFGVLLIVAGIGEILTAFWAGRWSGFLLHLLVGVLYLVAGFFVVDVEEAGERQVGVALALTMLLAAMLIVSGIFRVVSAMVLQFPQWGWVLLNGVVSILLGVMIYKQWPASGLWVIGVFIGIELIFNGWTWVATALNLRTLSEELEEA